VNPRADIALGEHDGSTIHEYRVCTGVIQMVMRINHKSHRQTCEFANRRKELLGRLQTEVAIGIDAFRCVYDNNSIIPDDESGVRPSRCFGFWI
jgi:hypothetical protein